MSEIIVKNFGNFEVLCDNIQIISPNARNTKAVLLFAFLSSNRKRKISQEELIEVLQITESSDNPYNVLKNTAYRLRKLFDSCNLPGDEVLLYSKNNYYLNDEIAFNIDKELFEQNAIKASNIDLEKAERLDLYYSLFDLYKGEYLPRLSSEIWVITQSVTLQKIYLKCLQEAWSLCDERNEYIKMLGYFDKAVSMYPYEEITAALRISCLTKLGKFEEANAFYIDYSNMVYNELGVAVGSDINKAYSELSGIAYNENDSIKTIRDEVLGQAYEAGAYFCNISSFISTYRFVIRNYERNSQSVYLILCTLYNEDGTQLKRGPMMKKACEDFYNAAGQSMRRGDIYTRYSPSQFLAMVSGIKQEDCSIVMNRIEKKFCELFNKKSIVLKCQVLPAIDFDNLSKITQNMIF